MTAANEFLISHSFNAPRELLFKVWTQPEHLAQWWGPKGFTVRVSKMDLRPGGTFHYCLGAPDGSDMWGLFVYREITPPERMVFVDHFSDAQGGITRHPYSASWPLEMLTTISFAESAGKTTVTIQWSPLNASIEEIRTFSESMESMNQGWTGTLEQLENYLASIQ